jgi:hypothetical protein
MKLAPIDLPTIRHADKRQPELSKLHQEHPLYEQHFQELVNLTADKSIKVWTELEAEWETQAASFTAQWVSELTLEQLIRALALAAEFNAAIRRRFFGGAPRDPRSRAASLSLRKRESTMPMTEKELEEVKEAKKLAREQGLRMTSVRGAGMWLRYEVYTKGKTPSACAAATFYVLRKLRGRKPAKD